MRMSKIEAWFRFAIRVWISLGLGWATLVVATFHFIRVDQAAALLVCSALVAEVFHEKRHRLFVYQVQPGVKQLSIYREVDVSDANRKDIEITSHEGRVGVTMVNTTSWALYHLAEPNEFRPDQESRAWDLERTMNRAERRVEYAIAATAVIGTIVWAFA